MDNERGNIITYALNNKLTSGLIQRYRENRGEDRHEGDEEFSFKLDRCDVLFRHVTG